MKLFTFFLGHADIVDDFAAEDLLSISNYTY